MANEESQDNITISDQDDQEYQQLLESSLSPSRWLFPQPTAEVIALTSEHLR